MKRALRGLDWPLLEKERLEAKLCTLPPNACEASGQLRRAVSCAEAGHWCRAGTYARNAERHAWEALHAGHWSLVPVGWRTMYMAAAYYVAASCVGAQEDGYDRRSSSNGRYDHVIEALRTLDLGLMLGELTFRKDLLRAAEALELELYSLRDCSSAPTRNAGGAPMGARLAVESTATSEVPRNGHSSSRGRRALSGTRTPPPLLKMPSLPFFYNECMVAATPAILTHVIDGWPACSAWKDMNYLKAAVGHRTVPVEIGAHYLDQAFEMKHSCSSYPKPEAWRVPAYLSVLLTQTNPKTEAPK